jgi:DNA-binding CsgD family transcriptional regulator
MSRCPDDRQPPRRSRVDAAERRVPLAVSPCTHTFDRPRAPAPEGLWHPDGRAGDAGHAVELGDGSRLHGRAAERAAIDGLLEGARRSRSGVLVLRGEAGVGKSALLGYALHRGGDLRVLQAAGVEPEAELAFAALHQLLRPVLGDIGRLPEAQAAAMRSALAISPGAAENRFVIAVATLGLMAELASDGPLLCLVDDAHWLDQPTADTLAFVARRLEAEGVVMLFATREAEGRSFPGAGLPERRVEGLEAAAADELLGARFGSALAPQVRRMIRESAQGIPLALHEIPTALTPGQLAGREALPQPLPIGHDLEAVFGDRVRRLPAPVQLLLLVAAAEGSGEAQVVLSAGGRLGIAPAALVDAEASGLLRTEGSALVFRHPVLRGAVYQGASLPHRQLVHQALAEVLQGEANADRRAWHRAALALHPDDELADELERTAERARSRSGHAAACSALTRAAELTSSPARRARRLASAARAAWDAGRPDRVTVLLRAAGTAADAGTHAELSHVRGELELSCGTPLEGATVLLEGAGRVATADPRKALQMLFDAAMCANYAGDTAVMAQAARTASTLPIKASAPEAPLVDLLTAVVAMLEAGDTGFRPRLQRALDRVAGTTEPRWLIWAGAAAAGSGDHAREDALRRRAEAIARSSMAVGTLAMVLERIAWAKMRLGWVAATAAHAEEGLRLATETGLTNSACFHRAILAHAAAIRGDEDACRQLAEQASETAMEHGLGPHNSIAQWSVGLLHLGLGRWEDAAARLEALTSSRPGIGHPYIATAALPDLVEAAARADRPEAAEAATGRYLAATSGGAPDWQVALATRCRALTTRVPDAMEKLLLEALAFHDRDRQPFHQARTLLLLGEHLRRERRRAEARPHLRSAVETFQRLGAAPWEARARAELRATGETARRREPSTFTQLTPQQVQIVRLVAQGATNKEVAAKLFLSPRTVDHHLRNVFAKLGISSRAELMRLSEVEEPAGTAR